MLFFFIYDGKQCVGSFGPCGQANGLQWKKSDVTLSSGEIVMRVLLFVCLFHIIMYSFFSITFC